MSMEMNKFLTETSKILFCSVNYIFIIYLLVLLTMVIIGTSFTNYFLSKSFENKIIKKENVLFNTICILLIINLFGQISNLFKCECFVGLPVSLLIGIIIEARKLF